MIPFNKAALCGPFRQSPWTVIHVMHMHLLQHCQGLYAGSRNVHVCSSREMLHGNGEIADRVVSHISLTCRWRMVRGDGEIIERIVSQSEARAINKQATHWISKPGAKGY